MNRILDILTLMFSFFGKGFSVVSTENYNVNRHQKTLFFFLLLTVYYSLVSAQSFPVQIIPQATPPAPIYFSDYADASTTSSPLRVQIILNDFEIANREVRLRTYFEGGNINFQSNDLVIGANPLFLEGGVPLVLTNVELAPYFRFENIAGVSPNVYGQAIPEGAYQFCFEVYDVLTGNRLSQKSCTISVVFQNGPPFLISPRNKTNVEEINPQNIVFQWTPRHINVTNVEYELSIVEIWDTQVNPQQAFLSSPPVFQATTSTTTYVYGPADPLFLSGKNYAWRVQAKAKQGIEEIGLFKNQGYSEIYSFSYAGSCDLPISINHEVKGSTNANVFWDDFSTDVPEYTVRYRKKGNDNQWFLNQTTTNQTTLWGLKAGTVYEYQVQKTCTVSSSDWSETKQFTTFIADNEASVYECGITPDFSLTNKDPLSNISAGDTFVAGDFPIKILEVSGSNGRFTGKGYVTIPYLNNIKVGVEFTNVLVNTDKQLAEGSLKTIYDPSLKNILDIDDVVETVDTVTDLVSEPFEGDNDLDEIWVNWEINPDRDIKVENGMVIITNPTNGASESEPLGDDKVIIDSEGKTYHIDAGGNITEGGQIDPGGAVTSDNVEGVSSNGDIRKLIAKDILVTFKTAEGTYGFDEIPELANSAIKKEYLTIKDGNGNDYTLVHKAVEKGKTAKLIAKVTQTGSKYKLEDIIFKTQQGEKIPTEVSEDNTIQLTLTGNYTFENETIYAVVPSKEDASKQLTAGAITLWHMTDRAVDVVLVSVNGANIPNGIEADIKAIFKKGVTTINVTSDKIDNQLDLDLLGSNSKLDIGESAWLTNYNDEQKAVISNLKPKIDYNQNTYYLFVFGNDVQPTKSIGGFMPLQRQFGFVFNSDVTADEERKGNLAKTIAHEIGHGVFALRHPFDQYGSGKESTNWLMDYANGSLLSHMDWAQLHNPELKFYVFQDEQDGEIAGKIWFTPDWRPFTVGNESHSIITKRSEHINGTVWGFKLNNGTKYRSELKNGKYQYVSENPTLQDPYPIEEKQLKKDDEINLFDTSEHCNKQWTVKYHPAIKSFADYIEKQPNAEFNLLGGCNTCDEGQKFISKYEDITDSDTQELIKEIAGLICDSPDDKLFLKEVTEKGIANLYGWQQSEYYDGNWDRSTKAFEKFRDSYKAYVDYYFKAKAYINTATERKAIIQIAYDLSEAQLGLLTVPERLHMLRQMATGPMQGYWTSSNYNVEALALKTIQSISFEDTEEFTNGLTDRTYSIDDKPLYLLLFERIDDFFGDGNFTQLILHLAGIALNKHDIDKQSASDVSVIKVNAQERFVWDVQNESFLWLFNKVQDNSEILVNKSPNGKIGLKQGCVDEKIYTTGYYGNTTNTDCAKYAVDTQLEPFDLVSIQIIRDITFVGSQGACNSQEAVVCGQESLVPAIFMLFLDGKKKSAITQNIITNTLTAASIYFSGAEIIAARGALTLATLPAYADLFVTFTDPYFSGPDFKENASNYIQKNFDLNKKKADEISDWLQVSWTIGSTVMTIDTAKKMPDPSEHLRALATYKSLVKRLGEIETKKLMSSNPELADKTFTGFKKIEDDLLKKGGADELEESTKKAQDELDAFLLKDKNYELGKVLKGKQNLLKDAEVSGKFRQFTINLEGQNEKVQRAGTFWNTSGEINPDIVQYFSDDGKYYLKHDPRDGRLLFFQVATKKCLGFTMDQDELFNKVLNNDYDKLIENLKQIHGFKKNFLLKLLNGDLRLSETKANIILGKWKPNVIEGIVGELGTDDVIEGLTIFRNYAFADDVIELRPGSIHLLNIPEGMYVPELFFPEFNMDFLDMAIRNKDKIRIILTNKPDNTDLLKAWDNKIDDFRYNTETNLFVPSTFAREIKYLRDRGVDKVQLGDGKSMDLNSIDLGFLDWSLE